MDWITLIGSVAAVCTTVAFFPQVMKIIKTKQTKDIALGMYAIMIVGIGLWLLYGILLHKWPIIIANAITFVLAVVILIYKLIYK
ncbi:MAG: hypothetical protein DRI95_01460 [Bacteroidetes bacterium]|nr:MAG: hypothetical protein DRI95_01460 [Bacteroidota bacterium]